MNPVIAKFYVLIMLECRLSYEEASRIFNTSVETLKNELFSKNLECYKPALDYLFYETSCYKGDNRKGIFKASIYIQRLRKSLKNSDKQARINELNALLIDLLGPNIDFAKNRTKYTDEERQKILKYFLKFGQNSISMRYEFNISHGAITNWTNNLPEGELKTRLEIFRNYRSDRYLSLKRAIKKGEINE